MRSMFRARRSTSTSGGDANVAGHGAAKPAREREHRYGRLRPRIRRQLGIRAERENSVEHVGTDS
jgi:hypothetical protein